MDANKSIRTKGKTILSYYNNMSKPVKASFWFVLCNIMQRGVSLLSTPIFTRIMTTEQYGLYSVYNSWYSIILILATLNLSSGVYNNAITHYMDDRDEITSSFQGLSTTVTLILVAVYLVGMGFWTDILELQPLLMLIMIVEIIFVPAYLFWTVGQRYDYEYRKIIPVTTILAVASPVLGIIAVLSTEYKAEARILTYSLVQIIIGIVFYVYNLKKGKKFYSRKYWKYALEFNIPLIPHYLSMTVLNQSDRIMISKMVGNSEAAIYNVAYTVAMLMNIINNAINSSFVPYTYKSLKNKNYDGLKKNTNLLLAFVGIMCILIMAFGPEVIALFATEEYYDAIWVIPPVAASVYFMFLYPLFSNVEFYYGKTKYVMYASCIGAVLNIALNYYFIRIFGYYAAGYTTLVCYIVFSFAHYILQRWIVKKEKIEAEEIYSTKFILLFSVVVLIAMLGMTVTYQHVIIRYFVIVVIAIGIIWKRNLIIKVVKDMRK